MEDPALADVALGGPDTMRRSRILQRFVRQTVTPISPSPIIGPVPIHQLGAGQRRPPDPTGLTQRWWTESASRVGCSPASPWTARDAARVDHGAGGLVSQPGLDRQRPRQLAGGNGYLGAENQLIRVMVAAPRAGRAQPRVGVR